MISHNEQHLKDMRHKGDCYSGMINTEGWKFLENHLVDIYMESFRNICNSNGNNVEMSDKAIIIVIENIFREVGVKVDVGEKARNDLLKLKLR